MLRFVAFVLLLFLGWPLFTTADVIFEDLSGEYTLEHSGLPFCGSRLSLQVHGTNLTRLSFGQNDELACSARSDRLALDRQRDNHTHKNELGVGVWTTVEFDCDDSAYYTTMNVYRPLETFDYGIYSLSPVLHQNSTKYVHFVRKNPPAWCVYRELNSTNGTSTLKKKQHSDSNNNTDESLVIESPRANPTPTEPSPTASPPPTSTNDQSSFQAVQDPNLNDTSSPSPVAESQSPKPSTIPPSPSASLSPGPITNAPSPLPDTNTDVPSISPIASTISSPKSPNTGIIEQQPSSSASPVSPGNSANPSAPIPSPSILPKPRQNQLPRPENSPKADTPKKEINGELWGGIFGGIATLAAAIITVVCVRKRKSRDSAEDSGVQVQVFTSDYIRRHDGEMSYQNLTVP